MTFSIVIPTYNREKDLQKCIDSILAQALLSHELVVIDDGNLSVSYIAALRALVEKQGVAFVYYKKDPSKERRGLSESKNIAIDLVKNEIFFIFDDDLVLDAQFTQAIMNQWRQNQDVLLIGLGGVIENSRKKSIFENLYNCFFGLTSEYSWDVTDVGFQVWDDHICIAEKAYVVHGGACSFKKSALKKLGGFSVFSGGRTALEDVDFCMHAKQAGYHFMIEPLAHTMHYHSAAGREDSRLIGYKESYNRKMIFKKNTPKTMKNCVWFGWSSFGWILRQMLTLHISKGFGMIQGIIS